MLDSHPFRLVTFLGKPRDGVYKVAEYRNPVSAEPASYESQFVAEALFRFLHPQEVVVLATVDAWKGLGPELQKTIPNGSAIVHWQELPPGQTESELWSQFDVLKNALRLPCGAPSPHVALDITHGFRSAPFFAAGALLFLRLIDEPSPEYSIYYGALEATIGGQTPIWDLTAFMDLVSWSSDIMLFLRTGRAEGLASATESIGRSLRREWAMSGQVGMRPNLDQLGRALALFGGDLETVRTGSLMLSVSKESSCRQLQKAVAAARPATAAIPPLADVLDRINDLVSPLITESRLSEPAGIAALQELARTYFRMGRYAEAASTMREAYINRYACSQSDCPGQPDFRKEHREAAERDWRERDEFHAMNIGQVRNDVEHAGYNQHPMSPNVLREKISELIESLTQEASK